GYLGARSDFRERYELPSTRGSAPDVQRRLSRRLQPFLLRRRKRDVAKDLPEKIEQVVPCSLTSHQRTAYDALLREIQQGLGSSSKNVNAGAQRMKMLTGRLRLRQVCCDLRLVGIDLSAADTVIHFDPWWNPAVEAQATDRAHRIGQTRVVTAYKLITRDTVEDKILRLQEKKRAAIDAAIDSEEPLMTGLTTEELEELLA